MMFFFLFSVTSIQSFPQDAKTPVAETVSPLSEKPKLLTSIVAPRESDFPQNDVDPYSELCTQQLDSLANLEEELEMDKVPPMSPKEKREQQVVVAAVKPQQLEPLDLKQNSESKVQQQQKLTTPGEWFFSVCFWNKSVRFYQNNVIIMYLLKRFVSWFVFCKFWKSLQFFAISGTNC